MNSTIQDKTKLVNSVFSKVYNKENENCPNSSCKNKIKKLNISNRSTFYCNICQK